MFPPPQFLHNGSLLSYCVHFRSTAKCFTSRARDVLKLCRCEFGVAGDSYEGESPEGMSVHFGELTPGRCGLLRRPPPRGQDRNAEPAVRPRKRQERDLDGRSEERRFPDSLPHSAEAAVRTSFGLTMRFGWLARTAFVFFGSGCR